MIVCFPLNPLALLKLFEPHGNNILSVLGIICWPVGIVFEIYAFLYFRLKVNVRKGKSNVYANSLVTSGLYSAIRHVQYTGGILSIFIALLSIDIYYSWSSYILLTYLGLKKKR
jgi:protein-S-isoprenylcysteine O-methyltransferase Ste14